MGIPRLPSKDPDAVKDYGIDWVDWLGTDTINTSTWTVPATITKDKDSKTTSTTTIWLSGGAAGTVYALTNHITTAGGRKTDQTIEVRVVER